VRLVHRPDHEGRLQPVLEAGHHRRLAEDWELAWRRSRTPAALVVALDAGTRIALGRALEADGYAVVTCPGPRVTRCPAGRLGAGATERCPRVPADVRVITLDAAAASTRLADAYAAWAPAATIHYAPERAVAVLGDAVLGGVAPGV
jgi:hypothetical protein